jgi:SAM-dependent methyltransferase
VSDDTGNDLPATHGPKTPPSDPLDPVDALRLREAFREDYWLKRDPIYSDRLLWRAQTFRHLVHLLPGQTILEIGCGHGLFTRALDTVSGGRNPITAISFSSVESGRPGVPPSVEVRHISSFPGDLEGETFDFVVAMDLLDRRNCAWFVQQVMGLLKPGGQVLLYESNPLNVVLKLRRLFSRALGSKDERYLLNRDALYELLSEVGFIRVFAVYNDFVYAPLTRSLIWFLRNLSIVLENVPGVRTLAGSILIHAQKPPRRTQLPKVSLCKHEELRGAVSVVVPCRNEEMNVEAVVNGLETYYADYLHEIVLVDDNSEDGTRDVMEELAARNPKVRPVFRSPPAGVGRAIADGFRATTGRYVLSMDCDFQHLLPQFQDLFDAAAAGHDVVVGSRFSRHSVLLNYPYQKIIANRGFHVLAQLMLRRRFRDVTNNLKLMRREVVDDLRLSEPGFAVNAETGLQPIQMGYSVKEVNISWINRDPGMGVSSFRLAKVGGGYWRVLLNLWRRPVTRSRTPET